MKTLLVVPLALLAVASPAFAKIPLRWAPVLRETLPQVHKGRAGEISANMNGLILDGLDADHATLVALSRAGIEDLERLEKLLSSPDASARAAALGADARKLESLRLSLEVLTPALRRLQARGLKPYSVARSRFIPALSRALEEQAPASAQAVAAAGRPDPDVMRDAPADTPPARSPQPASLPGTSKPGPRPRRSDAASDRGFAGARRPAREARGSRRDP